MMGIVGTLIPIVISCAAFTFSIFTWQGHRRQDKRDLLLKIHERLTDVDIQRGRRILYQKVRSVEEAKTLFLENPEDYDLANRALSMLNMAALYVEYGYVDKELFMLDWGFVFASIFENCQHFIAERIERNSVQPQAWPHFRHLAMEAAAREWDNHDLPSAKKKLRFPIRKSHKHTVI